MPHMLPAPPKSSETRAIMLLILAFRGSSERGFRTILNRPHPPRAWNRFEFCHFSGDTEWLSREVIIVHGQVFGLRQQLLQPVVLFGIVHELDALSCDWMIRLAASRAWLPHRGAARCRSDFKTLLLEARA